VGTWPLGGWDSEPDYTDRIRAYMTKARHEAKTHTSWVNPHPTYQQAGDSFVQAVLAPERSGEFLRAVDAFVDTIALPGLWNSLAQLVVKAAAPGVPDFFQGTELWDFSLVDPDNRRLVDFARRRSWLSDLLAETEARGFPPIESMWATPRDGRIKLWITAASLRLRRAHPTLFEQGSYQPLFPGGSAAEHVFSFARTDGKNWVIAATGRFFAAMGASPPLGAAWGDTRLPLPADCANRQLRDALTGRVLDGPSGGHEASLDVATIFQRLPVALLETIS